MKTFTQRETQAPRDGGVREQYVVPEVDIFETKDGYVLQAEIPGVNKEGLQVMLEGTELTLLARRQSEATPGEPLVKECSTLDYRRVFELDPAIDSGKISAKVEQGILTLTLPKSERVKPRRIAVE